MPHTLSFVGHADSPSKFKDVIKTRIGIDPSSGDGDMDISPRTSGVKACKY